MVDQEITRALITLSAVTLGFVLGQLADWYRNRRQTEKEKKAIRKIVNLEFERNISLLRQYWKTVIGSDDEWLNDEKKLNFVKLGKRIIDYPFPVIVKNAWLSHIGKITLAYSDEEIGDLWKRYDNMEQLSNVYSELRLLEKTSTDEGRFAEASRDMGTGGVITNLVGSARFANGAKKLSSLFLSLMRECLGQ